MDILVIGYAVRFYSAPGMKGRRDDIELFDLKEDAINFRDELRKNKRWSKPKIVEEKMYRYSKAKPKTKAKAAKAKPKKKGRVGAVGSGLKKYNSFIKNDRSVKSKAVQLKELERKLAAKKKEVAAAKKAAAKKYRSK